MKTFKLLFLAILSTSVLMSCGDDDSTVFSDDIAEVYVSSNTTGMISYFEVEEDFQYDMEQVMVQAQDADGIYYDDSDNTIYQVNRTSNVVNAYADITDFDDGDTWTPSATSVAGEFMNGREIAYSNGQVIVADDDTDDILPTSSDRFVIYSAMPNDLQYQKTLLTPTNLWGIQLVGNNLWAIEDNSSNVVVFNNIFSNNDGDVVTPDKVVEVEGIIRTHGLFYDQNSDVMILTDVADGTNDSDGAFSVISGFASKFNNQDMISNSDQITVRGSNTMLGNPVDVAYEHESATVYIAERANAGGQFLVFEVPAQDGNIAPVISQSVAGASAIDIE